MHCEGGQYISKYLASLFTVSIYIQINWPDFFNVQTKKKQKTHSDPCRIAHVSPITARYTVLAAGCGGKGRGGGECVSTGTVLAGAAGENLVWYH